MKKSNDYSKGYNDALEYCLKVIEQSNEYHKNIAQCVTRSLKQGIKK